MESLEWPRFTQKFVQMGQSRNFTLSTLMERLGQCRGKVGANSQESLA